MSNKMTISNEREYEFWVEFMRTDSSIEKFKVVNKSDYVGFEVEIQYEYAK